MVAPIIQVQYDQLVAVAARFQRATTTITSLRQQLQRTVAQLHDDWHGAAATAFFQQYQGELQPALDRLIVLLQTGGTVVMGIHAGMQPKPRQPRSLLAILAIFCWADRGRHLVR